MSTVELNPPSAERGGLSGYVRDMLAWGDLRRSPYGLTPVVILTLAQIVPVVPLLVLTVAGPNIAQDLNMDLNTVGGVFAITGTLGIVGSLVMGWLADRVRRVSLMVAGLVIQGISAVFQAGAGTTGVFAASYASFQLATDAVSTPQSSVLSDSYPVAVRGRAFSIFGGLTFAPFAFFPPIVGLLVLKFGWRSTTMGAAIPLLLLAGVMLWRLREPRRGFFERRAYGLSEEEAQREDPPVSFGEGWRTLWSIRTQRRLFWSSVIGEVAGGPYDAFSFFILASVYGLNVFERSLINVPALVLSLLGVLVGGSLIDVLGRRTPGSVMRTLGAVGLFRVAGVALIAFLPPLWVFIVITALMQFARTFALPAFFSINSQIIPAHIRSQGLQVLQLASIPARVMTGLIFARIAQDYGFTPMILATIPFGIVSALIAISAGDFFEGDRANALAATAANEEVRKAAREGATKLLLCRGVNVFYQGNQVLFGVDFEVEQGEVVALLGTNGAGKSTLLRAISGTQEAADGAIVLEGREITHMPPHEIAARGIVHMPGGRGIFPGLTVDENLRLATWLAPSRNVDRLLDDAYKQFPRLAERKGATAGLLSGGEQQMLALAQAMMQRPRLLMIDELSLGLAPSVVSELLEKVKEISERGTTVIVVEQSVNLALTIAKRAVFMEKGEIRFSGPTADLLRRPDIMRAVYVKGTGALLSPAVAAAPRREIATARTILEAKEISKAYGGVQALDGVDLALREGQILGIVGPNGSGKTTLLDILSGYQAPDSGRVLFEGRDVTELAPHQRARLRLVRRFQDARLAPSLTVFETLLVALDRRLEVRSSGLSALQLPAARRAERRIRLRAERLIELLRLESYRDKFVKELSTGVRRLTDLAVVLAAEPQVLLLDEPSAGVAQAEAESLGPLLQQVRHETGCTMLVIEHDMPLISSLADELVAFVRGRVVARGTADEVLNDTRVVEAFMGGSEEAIRRSGALV